MAAIQPSKDNDNIIRRVDQFSEYVRGRVMSSTADLYVSAVKSWIAWCRTNNQLLGPKSAQLYADEMAKNKLSPQTVSSKSHGVMRYLRWRGFAVKLDLPSIKQKEPEYLKPNEVQKVIDNCRDILEKALIVPLYDTAVRISELLNLMVEDIDKDQLMIEVTRKGGARDRVNISENGLKALTDWMKSRNVVKGRVFLGLSYESAWGIIKGIGERAGFGQKVHPHLFRHSRAIAMLMAGTDIYIVQRHLGHKSVSTTLDCYGRFMAADIKKRIPDTGMKTGGR